MPRVRAISFKVSTAARAADGSVVIGLHDGRKARVLVIGCSEQAAMNLAEKILRCLASDDPPRRDAR